MEAAGRPPGAVTGALANERMEASMLKLKYRVVVLASTLALWAAPAAFAQTNRLEELANQIFAAGYPTAQASQRLNDELVFQSAVQTYLWALPALNMYGMKEGSEKIFGKGYNVLPIWKQRLNAKTLITTPNSMSSTRWVISTSRRMARS
jgi:hypothetical protein